MSALGQKRTLQDVNAMSALPPKADIPDGELNVRFVPIADIDELTPLPLLRSLQMASHQTFVLADKSPF
jgi:hypothetical protein